MPRRWTDTEWRDAAQGKVSSTRPPHAKRKAYKLVSFIKTLLDNGKLTDRQIAEAAVDSNIWYSRREQKPRNWGTSVNRMLEIVQAVRSVQ